MFSTLEDIKKHCEEAFPNTIPLKVESLISAPPRGIEYYQIKIYLMAPDVPEFVKPLRNRLDDIKKLVDVSIFEAKTQYGKVQPIGYHFELTVRPITKNE